MLANERPVRIALVIGTIASLIVAVALSAQPAKPAAPMQVEKVKDGLYLIRRSVQSLRAERLVPRPMVMTACCTKRATWRFASRPRG